MPRVPIAMARGGALPAEARLNVHTLFTWVPAGSLQVDMGVQADSDGELFAQVLPAGEGLAVLALATLTFLVAAVWVFSEREYVLDQ